MKTRKIIFFAILLFCCRSVFAQNLESSITIKIDDVDFNVSGVVTSEVVKNEVIGKIETHFGSKIDFRNIIIRADAEPLKSNWQTEFDRCLSTIKSLKIVTFVFSNKQIPAGMNSAALPDELLKARFTLSNGKTVSLKDYKNKVVVLFFLASWCGPCRTQAETLRDFYPQIASRKVEIIGIGADNDGSEKTDLPKLFKILNLPFQYGWTSDTEIENFLKFSKSTGIPQSFIILNERIYGVFMGNAQKNAEKLKETILKVADENNL